jgi:ribosomal protein S18 acetylase RimI-like enzyme
VSSIRIRTARSGEGAAIAAVYIDAWRAAYAGILPDSVLVRMSPAQQQRVWTHQIHSLDTVLVAVHPRHGVVGVASGGRCRDRRFADGGEIFTLYVAPDHQGQGCGKALLQEMQGALRDAGHEFAVLWVLADNHARFFYEAMGGIRTAERHERLWGVSLPEIAYQWRPLQPSARPGRFGAPKGRYSLSRSGDSNE